MSAKNETRQRREVKPRSGRKNILFLLDWRCFDSLKNGSYPVLPYSHDKNLLLFAHEALKQGDSVWFARTLSEAQQTTVSKVTSIFPVFVAEPGELRPRDVHIVTSAGVEQLDVRPIFPDAKIVAVVPALHMIESPLLFTGEHPLRWVSAVRDHIDFFVTQNARMKDILRMLCQWLGRWDPDERILVAPFGYAIEQLKKSDDRDVARRKLGLAADDILVVNSGGAWSWTDCDTTLEAFVRYLDKANSRIKFYFPALRQPDNLEPNAVADTIERMMKKFPRLFSSKLSARSRICIESSWSVGGRALPTVLDAADLGLCVSKGGFESWQSHRVRFVDYATHGLPALSTPCLLSEKFLTSSVIVKPEAIGSYLNAFDFIDNFSEKLSEMKLSLLEERKFLSSDNTYAPALKKIKKSTRRDVQGLEYSFIDAEMRQIVAHVRNATSAKLDKMLG